MQTGDRLPVRSSARRGLHSRSRCVAIAARTCHLADSRRAGAFSEGETSGGGSIALEVGSIEKVFVRCGEEDLVSPDLDEPIGTDGSFSLQFSPDRELSGWRAFLRAILR